MSEKVSFFTYRSALFFNAIRPVFDWMMDDNKCEYIGCPIKFVSLLMSLFIYFYDKFSKCKDKSEGRFFKARLF